MRRFTASIVAVFLISILVAGSALAQVPPAPTALDPTNINSNTFTANWDTSGKGQYQVINYRLDVSTDQTFTDVSKFLGIYNNAPVTGPYENVGPVTSLVTYYYRVRAVNASGTSDNSNTVTAPILFPPVALGATNITSTGFTANWSAVPGVTNYQIDVAKLSSFGPVVHTTTWDFNTGNVTSYTVTGLLPDTTYWYRVRTRNGTDSSGNSNMIAVSRILSAGPVASGTINVPYSVTLQFDGTATPQTWAVVGSLPPGLTIDAATGTISGTPTTLGTYNFTVQVTDNTPATVTKAMSIAIVPTPTIAFDAVVGNTYFANGGFNIPPSLSWNHTVGKGTNRMLIVQTGATSKVLSHVVATGVTYNGKPLTLAKQQSESSSGGADFISVGQWYMLEKDLPSDSAIHPVVITFADSLTGIAGGSISLNHVKQVAPEAVSSDSGVVNNLTDSITTLTNHAWLINAAVNGYSGGFFMGHNQEYRYQIDNGNFDIIGDTKEVATAGHDYMQAFHHIEYRMAQVVVAVAPVGPTLVYANPKVFLQGPYVAAGDTMSNNLKKNGWLAVHFGSILIPVLAVDSINIELRDSASASLATHRRFAPAWLLTNGSVRGFADTTQTSIAFDSVVAGKYYIVIRHRNHLAIMSAQKDSVDNNPGAVMYDFSTGQAKAYGTNAMKAVGTRFALFGGNANGDGAINAVDRNSFWRPQNGSFGYLGADFDLSGLVNAVDQNSYWRVNNGLLTQVP
jgi:hypothetical protein